MSHYAFAVPVLPGMAEQYREFARGLGSSAEGTAVHARAGIDRVRVYQQETPQGDFAVIVWDTDDGERALHALATATDDASRRFQSKLQEFHGIDASRPESVPKPELLAEWASSQFDSKGNDWAFLVPIGRGKVDAYRSMVDEMFHGSQRDGFEQTRRTLGVTRQMMFLLELPMGAFALPVLEGPGAARVFAEQLKRDDHPFFAWWRDQVRIVTGRIPTNPPKVEKLLDLITRVPATAKR